MDPLVLIAQRREHLQRLANEGGALGEALVLDYGVNWVPRPKGKGMRVLQDVLLRHGLGAVKPTSFDVISMPEGVVVDFRVPDEVERWFPEMTFVEIKSANQKRVKDDFAGFFFALTENEIIAAEALGDRHQVALFNKQSGKMLITSVRDIIARARSTTWQVSVQL